ncbi:hypothetical protein BJ875DRAFT_410865 [Amylocarpus encephaloides]|uniref:NAD-dependent epimerase/dehydratase domain-containing protein n=1 Tax=Amylocarpus encephaloides TaxID=45428 RepID=A0A9P7Y8R8_9HELO|nr:hypothetical protein BJ875DRAFT_410865 [Amylocarpus encephaloides]
MASFNILVTGVTGYIGGSVLSEILVSNPGILSKHSISVLVRGEDKAKVYETKGLRPILFNSLDELELLRQVASEHDIVIHTASGFHTAAARALVLGLGDRRKATGQEVHYVHTTGTSNLGDQNTTQKYTEDGRIFSDKEDIFSYLKSREALQVYAQRTTDIAVVETGLIHNVATTLIMSPTIYGFGSGLFNKHSIQIPILTRSALSTGQVEVVGQGTGVWDYVHISDLTKLYNLVFTKVLAGEVIPSGEQGIIFSGTGRYTWRELSQRIAWALSSLGAIKSEEVRSIDIPEAAEKWSGGLLLSVELGFASNSRTSADVSYELGWKPEKTAKDWENSFLEEAKALRPKN